jgi:hypothetical protein
MASANNNNIQPAPPLQSRKIFKKLNRLTVNQGNETNNLRLKQNENTHEFIIKRICTIDLTKFELVQELVTNTSSNAKVFKVKTKDKYYIIKITGVHNDNYDLFNSTQKQKQEQYKFNKQMITNEIDIYLKIMNSFIIYKINPYVLIGYNYNQCGKGKDEKYALILETASEKTTQKVQNLKDFILKYNKEEKFNEFLFLNILIQIIYSINCFNKINFVHNDLNLENILIFIRKQNYLTNTNYMINSKTRLYFDTDKYIDIPNLGIDVRIFNFDKSIKFPSDFENNKYENNEFRLITEMNFYTDIYKVITELCEILTYDIYNPLSLTNQEQFNNAVLNHQKIDVIISIIFILQKFIKTKDYNSGLNDTDFEKLFHDNIKTIIINKIKAYNTNSNEIITDENIKKIKTKLKLLTNFHKYSFIELYNKKTITNSGFNIKSKQKLKELNINLDELFYKATEYLDFLKEEELYLDSDSDRIQINEYNINYIYKFYSLNTGHNNKADALEDIKINHFFYLLNKYGNYKLFEILNDLNLNTKQYNKLILLIVKDLLLLYKSEYFKILIKYYSKQLTENNLESNPKIAYNINSFSKILKMQIIQIINNKLIHFNDITTLKGISLILNKYFKQFNYYFDSNVFLGQGMHLTTLFYNIFNSLTIKNGNNEITHIKYNNKIIALNRNYFQIYTDFLLSLRKFLDWAYIFKYKQPNRLVFKEKFKNKINKIINLYINIFKIDTREKEFKIDTQEKDLIHQKIDEFMIYTNKVVNLGYVIAYMINAENIYLNSAQELTQKKNETIKNQTDAKRIDHYNILHFLKNINLIKVYRNNPEKYDGTDNLYDTQVIYSLLADFGYLVIEQSKFNPTFVRYLDIALKDLTGDIINMKNNTTKLDLTYKIDLSFLNTTSTQDRIQNIINFLAREATNNNLSLNLPLEELNKKLQKLSDYCNTYLQNQKKISPKLPNKLLNYNSMPEQYHLEQFRDKIFYQVNQTSNLMFPKKYSLITIFQLYGINKNNYQLLRLFFSTDYNLYSYSMIFLKILKTLLNNDNDYYQVIDSLLQDKVDLIKLKPILYEPTINEYVYHYARQILQAEKQKPIPKSISFKNNLNRLYNTNTNLPLKTTIKQKYGIRN